MNPFPLLVYRDAGTCQRPGGMYSWLCVRDVEELAVAAEEGYYPTIDLAVSKPEDFTWDGYAEEQGWIPPEDHGSDEEPEEEAPAPTRAELEAYLTENGVEFSDSESYEELATKVARFDAGELEATAEEPATEKSPEPEDAEEPATEEGETGTTVGE